MTSSKHDCTLGHSVMPVSYSSEIPPEVQIKEG